ncbi:hypothetical protein AADZ90_007885 [Aestuariibius sp. 2305UL40-4]|uniref:hypothetical protein n=1 Tax=Aestuariibius violaceus TaxID=3234132 RepID=UPI00345E1CC9
MGEGDGAMCLGVYLGAEVPLVAAHGAAGDLDFIESDWTPPPLQKVSHVYRVGQRGSNGRVYCSCLLLEHVDWTERGPVYRPDDDFSEDRPDPFEDLHVWSEDLLKRSSSGWVGLVCDDGGGEPSEYTSEAYEQRYLNLADIRRGSMIFSDLHGGFPVRSYTVINPVLPTKAL